MIIILFSLMFLACLMEVIMIYRNESNRARKDFWEATQSNAVILGALISLYLIPLVIEISILEFTDLPWSLSILLLFIWGVVLSYGWSKRIAASSELTIWLDPYRTRLSIKLPNEQGAPHPGCTLKKYNWELRIPGCLPMIMTTELLICPEDYSIKQHRPLQSQNHRVQDIQAEDILLDELAFCFWRLQFEYHQSSLLLACNVLAFVSSFVRAEMVSRGEKPARSPGQVLLEEKGSLDDLTVLAASILHRLGFDLFLLHFQDTIAIAISGADQLPGRFFIHPSSQKSFFFGSLTSTEWYLGETPEPTLFMSPVLSEYIPAN